MIDNKIAIIIPCYNEEHRLRVDQIRSFLANHQGTDLYMLNDGSSDGTLGLLNTLSDEFPSSVFVHDIVQNVGKAEAIRLGVQRLCAQGQYQYVGFIDADFSAPLVELVPLIYKMQQHNLLMIAGSRVKLLGRDIQRSMLRHYFGRIFATYYSTILQLPNYDTQCGLKIFEQQFAAQLFAQAFVSNWFFDIELFLRARNILGQEQYALKIAEEPLQEWREVGGSKLKLSDFIKAPFEVLKIYSKYKS